MRLSLASLTPMQADEVRSLDTEYQACAAEIFRRAPKDGLVRVSSGRECEHCSATGIPCFVKDPKVPRGRGRPRMSCEGCFIGKPKCTFLNRPRAMSHASTSASTSTRESTSTDTSTGTGDCAEFRPGARQLRAIRSTRQLQQPNEGPVLRRSPRSKAKTKDASSSTRKNDVKLKIKLDTSPPPSPSPAPTSASYYPTPTSPTSNPKTTGPSSLSPTPPPLNPSLWMVGYPRRRLDDDDGSLVAGYCPIPKHSFAADHTDRLESRKRRRLSSTPNSENEDAVTDEPSRESTQSQGRSDYWNIVLGRP